ncbi:hypothetical protein EIN_491830 [Entamoeba invadens IP1]|uniref:Myb-like domain-containing protein n=1 Tax=Entamoeba invadens IP1 TaxID=370355 RepID=A0A0A1UA09_ENTIV|nr:hypothetical protein EIN_491830 [Entamoeba invadens IP1]ELP88974.1 hypothetical protein EIN_491830 [Entamoeba invadens IP1]|eukprot:XP_004255745.1 hypothetical protein EIN_491830 [Entamoeba invadens IP1]
MANPHSSIPRPRSSPSQDDCPTPNIAEYIKSIPAWSPEEQLILEENMRHYPSSQNAEFKRLTLLMTNLPNKRLRDVSLRVKYMKAKEKGDITWENFLQSSFGQQKVELSPSHSVKSPRATPVEREDDSQKKGRRPIRMKKEDEDLSMSSNSNQVSSVVSSNYNVRGDRDASMSISSNNTTPLTFSQPPPQFQLQPPRAQLSTSNIPIQPQPHAYNRPGMFQQPTFQPPPQQQRVPQPPPQMMYPQQPQRDRYQLPDDQTCHQLLMDNERCIETITQSILQKRGDISESVAVFNSNFNRLMQITNQMGMMPAFGFQPMGINASPKFKKIDMPPQDLRNSQSTYGFDFSVGKPMQRDLSLDGRRSDLM